MATIKAIQSSSVRTSMNLPFPYPAPSLTSPTKVHQIQSGQVITDLCSVVKELVENSLDAGATSIDVRFRNHGLDSIEVQDNGKGISSADFESLALKHFTSKLSSYDDLTSLETFGFRGEALSSLCALSELHVVTAQSDSGAKGSRLAFESSGKLKCTSVTAAPRGTTVVVENLFHSLPVRRKELVRHIKREYAKVLGILQAYACIGEGVRFSVSNQMPKGARNLAFTTKANPTIRENIANVFGARTVAALIALDLELELKPTQKISAKLPDSQRQHGVSIRGHMSKPNYGEGRQAPDRQMFFVNSRPCGLPQFAKTFNDVYRTYNVTQSPFVFANLIIDTNAYDVNVSPDKRTILLHDQPALLDALKDALAEMFESYAPSVPATQVVNGRLPSYTTLSTSARGDIRPVIDDAQSLCSSPPIRSPPTAEARAVRSNRPRMPDRAVGNTTDKAAGDGIDHTETHLPSIRNNKVPGSDLISDPESDDTGRRSSTDEIDSIGPTCAQKGISESVPNAFDRMRARKSLREVAEDKFGNSATTKVTTGQFQKARTRSNRDWRSAPASKFTSVLRGFSASGPGNPTCESAGNGDHVSPGRGEPSDDASETISETERDSTLSQSDSQVSVGHPADDDGNDIVRVLSQTPPVTKESGDASSDGEYVDEETKRVAEDQRVAEMIREAEERSYRASEENLRRAERVMSARHGRQSTVNLVHTLPVSTDDIKDQQYGLIAPGPQSDSRAEAADRSRMDIDFESPDAETKLSLSICKGDFLRMRVIGQFNLGFILAYRRALEKDGTDQIFVIDQHAADEKFNFERLSQTTTLAPQRLVQAKRLELSAQDEEILLSNTAALERNGFRVEVDETGGMPTGQRCKLLSLPTSKDTTFGVADLEELIHLLSESVGSMAVGTDRVDGQNFMPRPSRVRRMLAMRACRSSIMVGKNLTQKQMTGVVRNMAGMEKPWNCPHGRPTMRHLAGLDRWDAWREGEKYWVGPGTKAGTGTDWAGYLAGREKRIRSTDEK